MRRHISKKLRFLLLLLLFSIAKAFPIAPGCFKICPRSYRPVCASDSRTYGNQCLFDIVKCSEKISAGVYIYVKHEGFCPTFSSPSFPSSALSSSSSSSFSSSASSKFPHYQRPVDLFSNFNANGRRRKNDDFGDGNDGKVNTNDKRDDNGNYDSYDGTATRNSLASDEKKKKSNEGNSVESLFVSQLGELKLSWGDPVSNRVWQPLAPNDDVANWWHPGMTSRNKLAREQALKLGSEADVTISGRSGSPSSSSTCKRFCSKVYNPVCGTDGVTYFNPCRLEIEDCLKGVRWGRRKIRVAVKGPCLGADWLARARRRRR